MGSASLDCRSCGGPRRLGRSTAKPASTALPVPCRRPSATGGGGRRRRTRRRRSARRCLRFSANWPSSLLDTSAMTPRPNCATLPVMLRSVSMLTVVPSPSADERGGDGGRRVALAARVAALGLEHHLAVGLVGLLDLGHALVLRGDRADLDLHGAAVLVALDLGELRAGQARGDALEIEEHLPRLLDGHLDPELSSIFTGPPAAVVRDLRGCRRRRRSRCRCSRSSRRRRRASSARAPRRRASSMASGQRLRASLTGIARLRRRSVATASSPSAGRRRAAGRPPRADQGLVGQADAHRVRPPSIGVSAVERRPQARRDPLLPLRVLDHLEHVAPSATHAARTSSPR